MFFFIKRIQTYIDILCHDKRTRRCRKYYIYIFAPQIVWAEMCSRKHQYTSTELYWANPGEMEPHKKGPSHEIKKTYLWFWKLNLSLWTGANVSQSYCCFVNFHNVATSTAPNKLISVYMEPRGMCLRSRPVSLGSPAAGRPPLERLVSADLCTDAATFFWNTSRVCETCRCPRFKHWKGGTANFQYRYSYIRFKC